MTTAMERLAKLVTHPEVEELEVTDRSMLIYCPDKVSAQHIEWKVTTYGYSLHIRKGFKSPAYFVSIQI